MLDIPPQLWYDLGMNKDTDMNDTGFGASEHELRAGLFYETVAFETASWDVCYSEELKIAMCKMRGQPLRLSPPSSWRKYGS